VIRRPVPETGSAIFRVLSGVDLGEVGRKEREMPGERAPKKSWTGRI
jgi:hypothetical protein